jgi:hypothetical protein
VSLLNRCSDHFYHCHIGSHTAPPHTHRRQGIENARRLFNEIDSDGNGVIEMAEFIAAYQKIDPNVSEEHLNRLFEEADFDEDGKLEFDEFLKGKSLNVLCITFAASLDSRANSLVLNSSLTNAKPTG